MFFGIAGIVLVAFIAAAIATDEVWNGLVASWDLDTPTHFYNLPRTLKAAQNEGWTDISGVNPPNGITTLGFEDDPTFVLLFENSEVIGVQVAFRVEDLNPDQPLQWGEIDAVIEKRLNDELYYTATVYFHHNESTDIREIRFQEKNGFLEIPTNASLLPLETNFWREKCIPTMGIHYNTWHNISDCGIVYPWFLLALEDNVMGLGFQGFGNLTQIGNRAWWETIPAGGIDDSMDDPPLCAVNTIAEFGTLSIHIWFVDGPQNITCS